MNDKATYLARAKCTNCGFKDSPCWGEYPKFRKINEIMCPNCYCKTLELDTTPLPTPTLAKDNK